MAFAHTSDKEIQCSNHSSTNRDAFCELFLLSHIPPGFRITSGEIVDSQQNCTGQLGVIIVNDDCPYMTIDTSGDVVTPIIADSVLCVMDVKRDLNGETIKRSIEKLRPVKALMPLHETLENLNGDVIEDPLEGSILTGFFGFIPQTDMETKTLDYIDSAPGVLDFVVCPGSFGIFSAQVLKVCGIDVPSNMIDRGYVKYIAKGKGLAMIFGILNSIASKRRFSSSNYVKYIHGNWTKGYITVQNSMVNTLATFWKDMISPQIYKSKDSHDKN